MSEPSNSFVDLLKARAKDLPSEKYGYQLPSGDGFGMDLVISAEPEVNESEMSFVLPFADGNRRDGVGDLLEVGGIDTSRPLLNILVPNSLSTYSDSFFMYSIQDAETTHFSGGRIPSIVHASDVLDRVDSKFGVAVLNSSTAWVVPTAMVSEDWIQFEVFVGFTIQDCPDAWISYAEHFGQFRLRVASSGVQVVDFNDEFFGEFCTPCSGSNGSCSVLIPILAVVDVCVPPEITELIVRRVSVVVTTFHTCGAWTNEGFQYQPVDFPGFTLNADCLPSLFVGLLQKDFTFDSAFTLGLIFVWARYDVLAYPDPTAIGYSMVNEFWAIPPTFDGSIFVMLNGFVELSPENVRHARFPLRFPCEEWAGGGNSAFQVYGPSPYCSTNELPRSQGRAA